MTNSTIAFARTHHQYSLRLARPSNRAYFFQNRAAALGNEMPYQGAHRGGAPSGPTGAEPADCGA